MNTVNLAIDTTQGVVARKNIFLNKILILVTLSRTKFLFQKLFQTTKVWKFAWKQKNIVVIVNLLTLSFTVTNINMLIWHWIWKLNALYQMEQRSHSILKEIVSVAFQRAYSCLQISHHLLLLIIWRSVAQTLLQLCLGDFEFDF